MKEKVALFEHMYRTNPKTAEIVKAELSKKDGKLIYDVGSMRQLPKNTIKEINEFMQDYRILCVSTHKDSDRMWSDYAEKHKGIALRIEPNLAKNSKFQLFRAVEYHVARPPLYEDTLEFMASGLFGDQEAGRKATLDKIVYSKTLHWQHEGEYRSCNTASEG